MSEENIMYRIESSPQIRHADSTARIMWSVVLALLPAGIWSVVNFGPYVLAVIAVSVITAVVLEYLLARLMGRSTIQDGSAVLTGLLIAYNMPPGVGLFIPIIASAFAIAVVKWSFGGLGANWINPALAGRVFVFFSWTGAMTTWKAPRFWSAVDTTSGATVLSTVKTSLLDAEGIISGGPAGLLGDLGYQSTAFARQAASWFSDTLNIGVAPIHIDLFIGTVPGSLGEVSALLLILGGIYLAAKHIITWHTPISYILSFSLLIWIFGGVQYGTGLFSGDVLFHLFSGGMMLGALFMATDMVTSPTTYAGMIIFGIFTGFLTFLFRIYGSLPEGVSLAIIIMNIFVPMIDRYIQPRRFGMVKQRSQA
jgi:Na+-translocating ferredoxin:NAD+ oxidoreductase subunit D